MDAKIKAIANEMDLQSAIKSLDEMFQGWLGSERCSDELSSKKERQEIGFNYRKIREILNSIEPEKPVDPFGNEWSRSVSTN